LHIETLSDSCLDLGVGHPVHLPGGLADQQAQHLGLRRQLHQRELDALVARQLLPKGLRSRA
jgi:hypothetical protein